MIQLHHYWPAFICITLAILWVVALWEFSTTVKDQFLKKERAKARRRPDKPQSLSRYHAEMRKFWTMRLGLPILGLAAIAATFYYIRAEQRDYELGLLYGRLYPANDPDYGPCPATPGSVNLHLGSMEVQEPKSKLPVAMVTVAGKPVISLDHGADGSLVLIADVKDSSGRLIVRFGKDEFRVNPNNYFAMNHPHDSKSELTVIDQDGNVVLDGRYDNPHAFSLTGRLYAYGTLITLSNKEGIEGGRFGVANICVKETPGSMSSSIVNFAANMGASTEKP